MCAMAISYYEHSLSYAVSAQYIGQFKIPPEPPFSVGWYCASK